MHGGDNDATILAYLCLMCIDKCILVILGHLVILQLLVY